MNFFGIFRFMALVAPTAIIPAELDYSEDELNKTLKIISYNAYNKSIVNELAQLQPSFDSVSNISMNPQLPVIILLAEDSVNTVDQWVELHDTFMSNQEHYKLVIIEGSHYLHRMSAEEVVNETNEFIKLTNSIK